MLIKTKNILCETKEIFNTWTLPSGPLDTSGDILWSSVVYIKNTGEIWTHGILLGGTLANTTADKVDITLNNISKSISLHGHTLPYTTLTGSTTEANLAILSSGVKDKWILKTLGKNAFSNDDFLLANATAESAKRVVNDFIVSIKGESFISFNGSEAKTLNFIPGLNVSILSNSSGDLTISADAGDDTTNTAGATNKEDTKLFLIGAEALTSSPQTYSNQFVYIGTDNNLYSNGSKVWSSGNDGSGSGLDADTVDGVHNGDFTASIWKANRLNSTDDLNDYNGANYYGKAFYIGGGELTTNKPSGIEAYGLLVLRSAEGHTTQLLSSTNVSRGLYWRGGVNSNLGSWNKIAFISDNVASASKLSPGCKIWGQAFTGEKNITGALTDVGSIKSMNNGLYLYTSDGYNVFSHATSSENTFVNSTNGNNVYLGYQGTNSIYFYGGQTEGFSQGTQLGSWNTTRLYIATSLGVGTSSPQAKLHVVGDAKVEGEIYSNEYKVWHEGNDGSGSGLDADKLDGKHLSVKGNYFDKIPYVGSDGVTELGKYIDFHYTSTDSADYSVRFNVPNVSGISITLPSKAGTLALVGDLVSGAGYARKLYKIDSTDRTWTTAADIVGNGLVYYSDKSTSGRWTDYGSIFLFSNVDNPDPGTSSHWVTLLWSSTSNKLGVRWRTNTGSWSSMLNILTDGNYSSTLNSKYVTLDTTQTITGKKTFGDIVIPSGKYIYGKDESGGSMVCFDGKRTILGSIGATSTSATHIRSKTGHATIGSSNEASYTILDTGNYTSTLDGRYVNVSGDTLTGILKIKGGTDSPGNGILTTSGIGLVMYAGDVTWLGGYSGETCIRSGSTTDLFHKTNDTKYKIWTAGNDGSGSGLDADLLDGKHASEFATSGHSHSYLPKLDTRSTEYIPYDSDLSKGLSATHLKYNKTDNLNDGGTYHTSLYLHPWYDKSGGAAHNLALTDNGNMWIRSGTTAWGSWKEFAFTTSNVESASKLATKRTIWGQGFDGTANITGSLSSVANITMNGQLKIYASSSDTTHLLNLQSESTYNKIQSNGSIPLAINPDGNNVAIGATTASYKLWVNGTTAGTSLYATTGYVYCTKGWFLNDTAGTGLYNKALNARWQANGGVWNADKPIISSGYIKSTVATGTAPILVTSTTACTNLNADLLDGQHGSRYLLCLGSSNYKTITVGGSSNTYYPVMITSVSSYYPLLFVNISRTHNETAPSDWNTSTHKGGLTMTLLWNGSKYWDGNGSGKVNEYLNCVYLKETYSTMVGGLDISTEGAVVWLRGGTATYHIHGMNGSSISATVYTSTHTDSASRSFAPKTSPSSVTVRWPGASESASKLGTSTVGSGTKPIYLSSGTPTASSSTVGSSSVPVYLNSGTITKCTASSLFSTLSSSTSTNLSVTIGGQNRTITDLYAYKADQLTTSRTLWGKSFNGSANISGDMTSVGNITMSGGYIYNAKGMRDTRSTTDYTEFYKNWGTSYCKLLFSTTTGTNTGFVPTILLLAGAGGLQVDTHSENSSKRTYFWVGYSTSKGAKAVLTTGNMYATKVYAGSTQLTSDIRLKNRISTYKCDLYDKLKNITPFYYTMKGEEDLICLGFSANEIYHSFPEFIDKLQDLDNKYCLHYYTVDFATFGSLVAVMGYKELYRKNLEQIKKTDKIEKRVAKLTKKYRELKKLVDLLLLNNE